ncbi:MAG: TonB-dependent receptor [Acidobacteriaceae bacterium]|nr:TonB-dependent receptor [Acidobacteriaceae bacterium]MBV9780831.1 TonB-dependent receptor [Acidobacteriaceae bacterium]
MRPNTLLCICRGFLAFLFFVTAVYAQGQANRATITGTVTDASGAVVADVEVTATNLGTQEINRGVTTGAGVYTIPNLFPGTYSLNFSKAGFQPIAIPSITLESTQVAKFDETLAVGSNKQTVTVTAEAPILDSETATIGTHLSGQVITDLPLNINGGRDAEAFAYALTPGYSLTSNTYNAVINGTQANTKDFTVDGTSGTATIQGDEIEIGPTMEALQEVEAQTSGLQAQNGITNGGVVMFNLKSGTNQLHGTAFDYGHNEFLDARSWGNPIKPKARFWDWGFSAGGPIKKNKIFVFGAFERYQQHDYTLGGLGANTGAATVPTSAFLMGDFSALLNTSTVLGTDTHGNPIYAGAIFNPNDPGAVFPGNKIPPGLISPVSQKIIGIYQKNYAPESTALSGNERIPANGTPEQTPNQFVIKGDYNLTDRNHLSGSWVYDHRPRLNQDCGGVWENGSTTGGPLACGRFQLTVSNEFRASDSFTITPNVLNVFNATYNRYWNGSVPSSTGTDWLGQLGLGSTGVDNFPSINFGSPVNGVGETSIGNTWQGHYIGSTFIYNDSVSWTRGQHTFTFGGEFRAMQISSNAGSGALSLSFSNNTTGAPNANYANQVGFGFASFLLGDVATASESTPLNLYGRRKAMDVYAQDNWKITPKLTLNIGLRWDATFRFHEKYGHWANFDLNTIDPNLGIPGAVVYAKGGSDSFEKNEDWHNFGPQIGIAYNPWKRLVLRGSFGILYVPIGIQYYEGVPYGFAPGFRGTNVAPGPFNWNNGYPGVFMPGTLSTTLPINVIAVNIDPNALLAGYTNNWNLGAQYELTDTMRVEVDYIANRGHHLQDQGLNNNQPSAQRFFGVVNANANNGFGFNYVCNPAQAAANHVPYPYGGFCAPALAAIAPFPQLAEAASTYWFYPTLFYVGLPRGQSYYDSMAVQLIKRLSSGLTLNFSYTLSRQEGDTFYNFGDSYNTPGIQDFANLAEAAHTLSPYDQKHTVKSAVTYELPFGKGRAFLSSRGKFLNSLVSGWRVSGLMRYATGKPLTFYSSNYYYYPLWAATYVNYNLSGYNGSQFHPSQFNPITDTSNPPVGDLYFPKSVAVNPPYGKLGTGPSRIDALRTFGVASEDASLMKNTYFGPEGRFRLQLRVEFYNIFNRHTFADPDTNLKDATFGYVTGVNSLPRQGQFGIRFEW